VKFPIVLVGFLFFSAFALAQTPVVEEGWKGSVRPWIVRVFGEERAVFWLGAPPVVEEKVVLPALPALERKNTDTSVYTQNSELRDQGKEFAALPVERRRAYDFAFLQEAFQATRRAPAKPEDLAKWDNVLEGGGSREGIYRGLVLDDVYASLESYEENPSAKLVTWTIEFARTYLGQNFKPEAFDKANLFFIKRHMAEKSLEMMDALETKPEDFRSWYAVLSADLARTFPTVWTGAIRGRTEREVHLEWARKAPLQHIKMEAVIKLHLVMNGLQDQG
jgi:hypothetical protein